MSSALYARLVVFILFLCRFGLVAEMRIIRHDSSINIETDKGAFATFRWEASLPRPVLFPVYASDGTMMLRGFPLDETQEGQEKDHPHHIGIWLAHGSVQGTDYWSQRISEIPDRPQALLLSVDARTDEHGAAVIHSMHRWSPDGKHTDLMETRTMTFSETTAGERRIDLDIVLQAPDHDVVMGDTKEGFMAIRLAPFLRSKGPVASGHILNGEQLEDDAVWGKPSAWVSYQGGEPDHCYGIQFIDHAQNFRSPTTWHARNYGLLGANPFGIHDFTKAPKGAGDYTIAKDHQLHFRYRMLIHIGRRTLDDLQASALEYNNGHH